MPPKAKLNSISINKPKFDKNDYVFVSHYELLYEAKVLERRREDEDDQNSEWTYQVHYKGWKKTWDDWVSESRMQAITDETRALAAAMNEEFKQAQEQRKKSTASGKRKSLALATSNTNSNRRATSDANSISNRAGSDEGRHPSTPIQHQQQLQASTSSSSVLPRGLFNNTTNNSNNKRRRDPDIEDEEHFFTRKAIRLNVPDNLKSMLVDDWENVTKNLQLVPLPAEKPITKILDDYLQHERDPRTANYIREPYSAECDRLFEFVAGVKDYFNKALGRILLYRFERDQYHQKRLEWQSRIEKFENIRCASDVYGAEHLMRLFVILPEMIAQTNMDSQTIQALRVEINRILAWLSRNVDTYFVQEYETADAEYVNRATGQ
ncbi:MAG: hypothetical protein M1823_003722 [Watsoniomyces obsoletus]|nr:MAG: hypothetical protein M1823_003722 [Watsoniomyces obsoletus]